MTEARLKEIEYRWTDNFYDCDDLKEVFAEVRRLEKGGAAVESDLRAMIRYHGRVAGDRDRLRAALEKYAEGILIAISCEDGLDGAEGMCLLQETKEGRALLERMAGTPER